jgi:uncharacterized protein YjbJ (UPF0337 family)
MSLADKLNELKDRFSGAVEDAKGKAEELIGGATDLPVDQVGEQVTGAAEDLQGQAQDGVENAQGQAQEGVENAQGQAQDGVDNFKNDLGL